MCSLDIAVESPFVKFAYICDVLEDLKTITYTLADVIKDRREIYCHVNNSQTSKQKTGIILSVIHVDVNA
jgi:hypothetical protein